MSLRPTIRSTGFRPTIRVTIGDPGAGSPAYPDPNAEDWILAREAAGDVFTDEQKLAVHVFVIKQKDADRWDGIGHLYFTTSGLPDADAICLKTLEAGFFNNGTHHKGYWRGNGVDSFFFSDSPSNVMTPTSGMIFVLCPAAETRDGTFFYAGSRGAASEGEVSIYQFNNLAFYSFIGRGPGTEVASMTTVHNGALMIGDRNPTNGLGVTRVDNNSVLTGGGNTEVASSITNYGLVFGAAVDYQTFPVFSTNAAFGAFGMGMGFANQSERISFCQDTRDLWERLSGLKLPHSSITDPDAQHFILAREGAGENMTLAQQQAINTFITAEKTAGRWTKLKRLYFPTSGLAAPNAIDMVTRTSGTYTGGAFGHYPSYMLGNQVDSILNVGASPATLGLTTTSASLGVLLVAASNSYPCFHISGGNAGTHDLYDWGSAGYGVLMDWTGQAGSRQNNTAATRRPGILSGNVVGPLQYSRVRGTQGIVAEQERAFTADGALSPTSMEIGAKSGLGSSGAAYGAAWIGLGMTKAEDSAFTANLKTLWETYTGLALPYAHDDEARKWCDARAAAGEVMTLDKRNAVSAFISAERVGGRWDRMKRLYFTVSGQSAADAIDMVTRTPGIFVGNVTHTPGYAQSDGVSGYFNTGVSAATLGLTNAQGGFGFIGLDINVNETRGIMGAYTDASDWCLMQTNTFEGLRSLYGSNNTEALPFTSNTGDHCNGIVSFDIDPTSRRILRRTSAGSAMIASEPPTPSGVVPPHYMYFMALNEAGTALQLCPYRFGGFFIDLGYTAAQRDSFSANLKTFYEAYTGRLLGPDPDVVAFMANDPAITDARLYDFVEKVKAALDWSKFKCWPLASGQNGNGATVYGLGGLPVIGNATQNGALPAVTAQGRVITTNTQDITTGVVPTYLTGAIGSFMSLASVSGAGLGIIGSEVDGTSRGLGIDSFDPNYRRISSAFENFGVKTASQTFLAVGGGTPGTFWAQDATYFVGGDVALDGPHDPLRIVGSRGFVIPGTYKFSFAYQGHLTETMYQALRQAYLQTIGSTLP